MKLTTNINKNINMSKLNEIKSLLTSIKTKLSETVKLQRATLVDGTLAEWEGELEVGSDVWFVSEEGGSPAPDGTHETEEGLVFTTEDGKVTAIGEAEEESVEEEAVEEVVEEALEQVDYEEKFDALNERINSLTATVEELSSVLEASVETIEKLSKQPAVVTETKTVDNKFNKTKNKSRASEILNS